MSKHLPPPMRMSVERGRLVPASAYDAERLASYRVGSTVSVRFTADRTRPLERKYRAILGKVIKECKTPWTNAEAAHQAIKLACGIVNVGKTAGGELFQWPRSLVDLDDKEMEDYFNDAMVLIERLTGVDVATLKRETAHVDAEDDEIIDPETGEIINSNPGTDFPPSAAGSDEVSYASPSSTEPSDQPPADTGSTAEPARLSDAHASTAGSAPSKFTFGADERQHLIDFARKSLDDAASDQDEAAKLYAIDRMRLNYLDAVETADARQAIEAMDKALTAVAKRQRTREQAADYIAREIVGCGAHELEGRRNG